MYMVILETMFCTSVHGEAIPLQKGSCSLAGLKSCCMDTNASLPSHSGCVASMKVAELHP